MNSLQQRCFTAPIGAQDGRHTVTKMVARLGVRAPILHRKLGASH